MNAIYIIKCRDKWMRNLIELDLLEIQVKERLVLRKIICVKTVKLQTVYSSIIDTTSGFSDQNVWK